MNGLNDAYVESVIKKAISGKLKTGQAAAKLGISKQYVNRLKKAYSEKGPSCFAHGNKGKAKPWRTDPDTESAVIGLYEGKYAGFNFRHFVEKLNEDEGMRATYRNVHRILTSAGFRSPKRHKARKEKAKNPSRPRRQPFLLRKRKSFPPKAQNIRKVYAVSGFQRKNVPEDCIKNVFITCA